jgi:hypothetical protein
MERSTVQSCLAAPVFPDTAAVDRTLGEKPEARDERDTCRVVCYRGVFGAIDNSASLKIHGDGSATKELFERDQIQ